MKTAYELAMERLSNSEPTVALTEAQKKELAELDFDTANTLGRGIAHPPSITSVTVNADTIRFTTNGELTAGDLVIAAERRGLIGRI